ncbi:MAG: hypothetical protein GXN96_05415 [Aquificae bacterium]|nr:hypothetical protein [Aquificota bacterium]
MIGRVFRLFREKGGLLKSLGLWEWYESLPHDRQKKVKYYFSLKTVKNINFPYRAKDFDTGDPGEVPYTKRTFLGSLAQMALLEGDTEFAEWLYNEALSMEGSPLEAHMLLNDLILLAQKERDLEKVKKYVLMDVELYPRYREELRRRWGGTLPQITAFEIYVYLLEREGKIREALELVEWIKKEGITYPYYDEVKERLTKALRGNP